MELHLKRTLTWTGVLSALCLTAAALSPSETRAVSAPPAPARPPAAGTVYVTIPHQPLEALVEAASNVLYARVLAVTPVVDPGGMAYTDYELHVYAALKARVGETVHVGVAGAESAERVLHVPQAPRFAPGEELVLLTCDARGANLPAGILGLGLGTYRVTSDEHGALQAWNERAREALPLEWLLTRIESAISAHTNSQLEAK